MRGTMGGSFLEKSFRNVMKTLETFYGPNAGYVLELYERYKQDPAAVDATTRAMFQSWSPEEDIARSDGSVSTTAVAALDQTAQAAQAAAPVSQIIAATALAHAIRE